MPGTAAAPPQRRGPRTRFLERRQHRELLPKVVYLDPNGTDKDGWTEVPGGDGHDRLDDMVRFPDTPVTGTDYIESATNSEESKVHMSTYAIGPQESPVSITLWVFAATPAGRTLRCSVLNMSEERSMGVDIPVGTAASWHSVTYEGHITQATLDGLQVQCLNGVGTGTTTVYAAYIEFRLQVYKGVRWPEAEAKFKYNLGATGGAGATSIGAGFFGADGFQSVDLGSGRVLWMCGDTFMATAAGQNRSQCAVVRNSVGVTTGYDLSTATIAWYTGGTAGAPTEFFPAVAIDGVPYQRGTSGGVKLDDRVLAWGALLRPSDIWPFFAIYGTWVELFSGVDGTPDTWLGVKVQFGVPTGPWAAFPIGSPMDAGDGFVYFPLLLEGVAAELVVARASRADAKEGRLKNLKWPDQTGRFVRDSPDRKGQNPQRRARRYLDTVRFDVGPGNSYHVRPDGAWQLTGGGQFNADVMYGLAPHPSGVYTGRELIYRVPDAHSVFEGGKRMYSAMAHPFLTWSGKAANEYVIVYSTNDSNDDTSVFEDARYYWPEVLKVTGT